MKKFAFTLCLFWGALFTGSAQYQVFASLEQYDTLYTFDTGASQGSVIRRHFPAYDVYEKDLGKGFQPDMLNGPDNLQYFFFPFPVRADFVNDSMTFYQRIYTDNVAAFSIYLYDPDSAVWRESEFKSVAEGYQIPIHSRLKDWGKGNSPIRNMDPGRCYVVCSPANAKAPVKFVIGQLAIGNKYNIQVPIQEPFFDGITLAVSPKNRQIKKPTVLLSEFSLPSNIDYLSTLANLSIQKLGDAVPEPILVYQVLKKALDQYLFYEETGIDKKKAISSFDQMFRERLANVTTIDCDLSEDLSAYLRNTFQDPHFGIVKKEDCSDPPQSKKTRGPVRLYELHQKIRVAAVLDSAYMEVIPLGSELEAINGISVWKITDSLQQTLGPWTRRKDIISDLLKASRNDSMILDFKHTDTAVSVRYDGKWHIPENFVFNHCEYKLYHDSIAYFRINRWDLKVYFEFVKKWPELSRASSLILDLRKNGGGEFLSALRMLTLFVEQPTVLYRSQLPHDQYESFVVAPNPFLHFPTHKKIVILIDNHTACTSESFVLGMKNLDHVTLIGHDKTFGTDASRNDITFPSGFRVYINCIAPKNIYGENFIVENKGIEPDIWVQLKEVADLRPYDDKVLRSALRFLAY